MKELVKICLVWICLSFSQTVFALEFHIIFLSFEKSQEISLWEKILPASYGVTLDEVDPHKNCTEVEGGMYFDPQLGTHTHEKKEEKIKKKINMSSGSLVERQVSANSDVLEGKICPEFGGSFCVKVPSSEAIQDRKIATENAKKMEKPQVDLDFLLVFDISNSISRWDNLVRGDCKRSLGLWDALGFLEGKKVQLLSFDTNSQSLSPIYSRGQLEAKKKELALDICKAGRNTDMAKAAQISSSQASKNPHAQIIMITDKDEMMNGTLLKIQQSYGGRVETVKFEDFKSYFPSFLKSLNK